MYPSSNPYSWSTIGDMTDLTNASVEDVKQFFRLYYAPNNATLAIVGDFDPKQARTWVAKYFGDLPRGKAITRPTVSRSPLTSE
jgi:zinc protease